MLPAVFWGHKSIYEQYYAEYNDFGDMHVSDIFWWRIWSFFSIIHSLRINFNKNTVCHQCPSIVTKITVIIWQGFLPETQYWVLPISHISILRHFSLFFLFYHFVPLVSLLLFFLKLTKSRIFAPRKTNVEFDKFFSPVLNIGDNDDRISVQLKVEKGGCYIESIIHSIRSVAGWHPRVKPNHNLSSQIDSLKLKILTRPDTFMPSSSWSTVAKKV